MAEFSLANSDFTEFLPLMHRSCQLSPVWSPTAVLGAPRGLMEKDLLQVVFGKTG